MKLTAEDCIALDQQDPLGFCRDRFVVEPGRIYLDGNSLGALSTTAAHAIATTITDEWGKDLIQSWNKAGWFELPVRLGDRIGGLVGAAAGQIVVCDNTSINLYKALHAALALNPGRSRIIAHRGDFPTDLYMIQGAASSCGRPVSVELIDNEEDVARRFDDQVAVAVISQVNYKSSALQDMAAVTRAAHANGAMVVWDLCHSAGAMPLQLDQCEVDFAVGCTYKYLNGGPGSPAFVYAASRLHEKMRQPLCGWWSHQNPFDFCPDYKPANGIKRMLSGTQPILSLRGVECGLDTFQDVSMTDIRQKSMALCGLFIKLVQQECGDAGLEIIGPGAESDRGSHVSIAFTQGYPVIQAMIEQGVTGDFRAPDLMRFGFAPLYTGYAQIWNAVAILKSCVERQVWLEPRYNRVAAVT